MRRKRIAVLLAGVDREYQQAFAEGMQRAALQRDADLCIFNCQGHADGYERNDAAERAIFDLPELDCFDGVAVLPATIPDPKSWEKLLKMRAAHPDIPLISIDAVIEGGVQITFDDETTLGQLLTHMARDHGVRTCALLTGPEVSPVAVKRKEFCVQTLRGLGVQLPDDSIFDGRWAREGGRLAAEKLLQLGRELPQAVICGNDDMAFGLVERLREEGIRVPRDVLVTGFDAREEAVGRGLTTIRRPVGQAGELALETLLNWIDNGAPDQRCIVLQTELILGGSCGCAWDGREALKQVRRMSHERRYLDESLMRASAFFGKLAGAESEEEAGGIITRFARAWGAEEMHVCVRPDFPRDGVAGDIVFPGEMKLLAGHSTVGACDTQCFHVLRLLPVLDQPREKPLALVFSPLYHGDRNLGYVALDLAHASHVVLYSLLTLIAGALAGLMLRTTIRDYAETLEFISVHDSLTGLYNRRGFTQVAPPLFAQAVQAQQTFVIISCDMDDMKIINDQHGHMAGDEAIVRMGRVLEAMERETLHAVHVSGDEFLLTGMLSQGETADQLIDRLQQQVAALNREDPWLADIAVSAGVYAAVPGLQDQLEEFLIRADRCMYKDKKERKLRKRAQRCDA